MQELFSQVDIGAKPLWPLEMEQDDSGVVRRIATIVAVGIVFGLLSAIARYISESSGHIFSFCAADGVLAAFLLRRLRNRWWPLLVAAWAGDLVSILVVLGYPLAMGGTLAFCNVLESALAALLLQRSMRRERDLASPAMMLRFLLFVVLLAPAISGLLASICYHLSVGAGILFIFTRWFPPYALGMAVMTPLTLALGNPDMRKLFGRQRVLPTAGLLLMTFAATVLVFRQLHYSLIFLLLPLLMLVVFKVGILGAVIATFEILGVGAFYTLQGRGPFWMTQASTMRTSVLLLQCAILVLLLSIVPFAATLERQHQLRTRLRLGIQRYQLLADNSRDIVVLVNLEGRRLYVSPAIQEVLGWSQEEWTGQAASDFMHHEDQGAFQRLLREMLRGEDHRTFRYRMRHKNGSYLWMEANIRALPLEATGSVPAFVANVRDITERVESEQRLAQAHEQIQQQAERDSLTQLANRRCFDAALEKEWRRGRRTGNPIALLMVDVDHFKSVNDTYGHRAGDHCLQTLADILRKTARRPSDVAARYGGEEFAILLPDVNLETATVLADMLCMHVRQQLFEAGIGRALSLTVSVGAAALLPVRNARADLLVEAADRALYAAKEAGRDRAMPDYAAAEIPAALLYPVQ